MMNTAEILKSLVTLYKRYHYTLIAVLLAMMIALAVAFGNRTISAVIGVAAVAFFLAVTVPAKRRFKEEMVVSNLLLTTGRKIGAKAVEAKNVTVLSEDILKRAELIPVSAELAKPYFAWGMSGEDAKYRVALSDISLTQKIPNAPRTKSAAFNAGVWTHIELPFDTGRDYRLIDPAILAGEILDPFLDSCGLKKCEAGAENSKRRFIYADKNGTDGVPGNNALEKLDDLASFTPGITALSLRGRTLDVFVMNRFLAAEVSARVVPTAKMLEFNPFPELNRILALAMALRQDM